MALDLSQQIRCPVCLNDLKDPVCLTCEHFYCRVCITQHFIRNIGNSKCPECRKPFTKDHIRVNRALRNIVDAAKEHLNQHQVLRETVTPSLKGTVRGSLDFREKCPYHNEKFKLFCVTDQKLICVICKEEEKHRGHAFKTLDEAFTAKAQKTSEALETLFSKEQQLVNLFHSQAEEILKTREKSRVLSDKIFSQFEQMHQFLRDKEAEVKKQLDGEEDQILDIMGLNICTMEEMLADMREKQGVLMSVLETKKPCQFLQWWNEHGRSVIRDAVSFGTTSLSLEDVSVTLDTLSLGTYETHLQYFVWKQMLAAIDPVPHHHTVLNGGEQNVRVSPSGLCIQPKRVALKRNQPTSAWLRIEASFTSGQHFWEVEVGDKPDWGVGICSCNSGILIKDTVLCLSPNSGYHIQQSHDADMRTVNITSCFRKIAVYLDCEKNQVSFYNADNMALIDTRVLSNPQPHSLCLSPGLYLNRKNTDPLTICWY